MNRHQAAHLSLLVILILSMFMGTAQLIANNNTEKYQILEQYIPKLGINDTRSAYIKFQNDTGIYETTNGLTTELESFVEDAWIQDYRDYLRRKQQSEKRAEEREAFHKTAELMFNIIAAPFAFLLSPLYTTLPITRAVIQNTAQATTTIQETFQDINPLSVETFDKTIEDFQPTGIGSELPMVNYHILDNATHNFIVDPTNQTEGYYLPINTTYTELNSSRAQSARHWYNQTEETYTYSSDQLYNKTGLIDGTDWVTEEEYPHRYIIRLTNGSLYTFETPSELTTFYSQITNSTIWAVGYESITGVLAFYQNFADTDWGHGQYIFYPRLADGSLPAYNQPLYAIYPHLYANLSGTIYDQLLNDRSLYEGVVDPRDTMHFFVDADETGMWFNTYGLTISGRTWDIEQGFKYNTTDHYFHMITNMRCRDQDFDDIGMAYEITSSPQSDGTPYQPDRFLLTNGTHEILTNISQAWEAGAYLDDFYSQIEIISQNNASFPFDFTDMEDAGFTKKYLELHNQTFPDGSWRYTLRAGMYGYGSYTNMTVINIDPSVTNKEPTDYYDLNYYTSWQTTSTVGIVGFPGGTADYYVSYVAFDTVINVAITSTITAVNFQIYPAVSNFESGEGINTYCYNIGAHADGEGSGQARENSQSYTLGTNNFQVGMWDNPATGAYRSADTTKTDTQITYWANNRGSSENYISFSLLPWNGDDYTEDRINFYEAQYGSNEPRLSFTYVESTNTAPEVNIVTPPSANQYANKVVTVVADYWDDDGRSDLENIYLSLGTTQTATNDLRLYIDADVGAGTWTPTDVDNTADNYLISASVTLATSVTDGYRATWSVYWGYSYNWYDDGGTGDDTMDTHVFAYDGLAVGSGWDTHNTNANLEYELVLKSLVVWQGDASALNDAEWFKGGDTFSCTGVIAFEDALTVYPATDACDVQMWADNAASTLTDLGEGYDDDTLGASGQFDTQIGWVSPTDAGDDNSYEVAVTLTDFYSGASEGTGSADNERIAQRDNSIPEMSIIVASGTVGLPGYGSYDEDGVGFSINPSTRTDTGSGVSGVWYDVDDATPDAYFSASDPYVYPVDIGSDGTYTFYGQVVDNVGNVGIVRSDEVYVDETNPSLTSIYFGNEDYDAGLVAWFDQGDTATASMNIAFTEVNVYSIVVTCTGGLAPSDGGAAATSPFESTTSISGFGDTSGETMSVTITDRAGRTDTTFTGVVEQIALDNTNPIMTGIVVTGDGTVGGYEDWDQDGNGFSADRSAITETGSGVGAVWWDWNDATPDYANSMDDPYVFPDVGSDGTYTLYCLVVDNVGNEATLRSDIGYVDEADPQIGTLIPAENPEFTNEDYDEGTTAWFDQGDTATANYRIPFAESNVYSIVVTCTGGLSPSDAGVDQTSPFTSTISITGSGDLSAQTISITITDKSGRTDTTYAGDNAIALDNTDPIIIQDYENEVSDYLYSPYGDITTGCYSDNMGATLTTYTVGGDYTEAGSGVASVVDDTTFGDDPIIGLLTGDTWDANYDIDHLDDSFGSFTVTYTITDNVGQSDTVIYDFVLDNDYPLMASIVVTGDSPYGGYEMWDSDGAGFIINPSAITETGSGFKYYAFEEGDTTPDLYTTTDDPYTYPDDVGGTGTYTFYARAYDNCYNGGILRQYTVYVDEDDPVIGAPNFSNEDYLEGVIGWYDQGDIATANYAIPFTEPNVYSIVVTATGGLFPTDASAGQGSPFTSTININGFGDTNGELISITITDLVGRTDSTIPSGDTTIALDNTAPATTTFSSLVESSPYLYWDGTYLWISDEMEDAVQQFTLTVTAGADTGSGVDLIRFLDTDWGDNAPSDDSSAPYERIFDVTDNENNETLIIKAVDNVGNWENTLEIIIIDESGQNVELGVGVDYINESNTPTYNILINGGAEYGIGSGMNTFNMDFWMTGVNSGGRWSSDPHTGTYRFGIGYDSAYKIIQDVPNHFAEYYSYIEMWWAQEPFTTGAADIDVTFTYTDLSTDTVSIPIAGGTSWTFVNQSLVGLLDDGKVVDKITINSDHDYFLWMDDFELHVADSLYLYAPDNGTLFYGDGMSSAEVLRLYLDYVYNGSAGISHFNTTVSWWGDSPYTHNLTDGDQVINGGFEDGVFMPPYNWTGNGYMTGGGGTGVVEGSWALGLSANRWVTQTYSPAIPTSAVFSFWWAPISSARDITLRVNYSDNTYDDILYEGINYTPTNQYHFVTVSGLDAGKLISAITFTANSASVSNAQIDVVKIIASGLYLEFDIDNADTQIGTMYVAIWTNTGVTTNDTILIYRDIFADVGWTTANTSESSPYLYWDGTNQYGWYSDNMGAVGDIFTIGGSYSEYGLGLVEPIVNPDAETGDFTGWITEGSVTVRTSPYAHTGTYGFDAGYSSSGKFYQYLGGIPVDVIEGFSFWNYGLAGTSERVRVFYTDATSSSFGPLGVTGWEYHDYTASLTAGKYIDYIEFGRTDSSGTICPYDDIVLNYTSSGVAQFIDRVWLGNRGAEHPDIDFDRSTWDFAYPIRNNDGVFDSFNQTFNMTDNVGNVVSTHFYFYEDNTAPTGTQTLTQDPDALVVNWDNDVTAYTTFSGYSDPGSNPSGYNATHPVRYQLDSNGWLQWENDFDATWTTTEGTRTLKIQFHDYVENYVQYDIEIYVDLTDPTYTGAIFDWTNPTYSDNWYKSIDGTAEFDTFWIEANIYLINATQSSLGYEEIEASPSGGTTSFQIDISSEAEGWYDITVEYWDKSGRYKSLTYATDSQKLKIDNSVPTATFELEQHVDRLVDNYYKTITAYTDLTGSTDNGPSGGAGLPTNFIRYRLNGGTWSALTSTTYQSWTGIDQNNNTLEVKLIDNVGLESVIYEDWVITDITLPVLGWLTLNESWAPNWYDQDVSTTAQASINWVENYPFDVDATCTLAHTDDNSPSGGNSLINFTITGEADGAYSIAIRIRDNAGNEDTTLLGSSAPIQLNSGMSGLQIENWFYFYFFRNDGLGLDWRDFNTTYVLDEDYRNYTETRIRGALFAQKYLNLTSTIRFTVRNYFGDVIHNQSYSLPSSFDLYITLDVYTLKISNIAEDIMNMTIERTGSATLYQEQIMPYEIFAWNMYAAIYNVTIYVDSSDDFGYDPDGNAFNDTQLDLTGPDVARFVDASLRFTQNNMIISEIWQINVITNKDHKSTVPQISVYMNGTLQGGQSYAPGVIIFSRPTYGVYNYTIHGTWQSFSFTYQTTITVESNAIITNFVVAGLEDTNNYLEISWNTNKGTGSLNLRDNSSIVAIYGTEGVSHYRKSTTVGLHMMNFSIAVESRTYLFYANYTIPEWTAIISLSLLGETDLRVPLYESQTISIAVTRSDSGVFNGIVEINGTSVTITNGAGSVAIAAPLSASDGWAEVNYDITGVLDSIGGSRDYVGNDLDVVWDSVLVILSMSQAKAYQGEKTTFSVNATYRYDGTKPSLISFNVYLDDKISAAVADSTFDVVFDTLGQHKVKIEEITDEIYLIDYSSGFKSLTVDVVTPTGAAEPSGEEGAGALAAQWIVLLFLGIVFYVAYSRVIKPGYDSYTANQANKAVMQQNIRLTSGKNSMRMDMNGSKRRASGIKRRRTAKGRFS